VRLGGLDQPKKKSVASWKIDDVLLAQLFKQLRYGVPILCSILSVK
jgi:hypothetical protein